MSSLAAVLVLTVTAAGPVAAAPDPLTFQGLGPVTLRMTVDQALATGAMAPDQALCPGEDTDFVPSYKARSVWSAKGRLIAIQAGSSIRGIRLGTAATTMKKAFPGGSFRGRDIYTDGRIWVVRKPDSSLQFVVKKGKVRRIALTTGFVSTGGEWTC